MNRADMIESRSAMVGSVLTMLLGAMQEDCPPSNEEVHNVIWAAAELLNIPKDVENVA